MYNVYPSQCVQCVPPHKVIQCVQCLSTHKVIQCVPLTRGLKTGAVNATAISLYSTRSSPKGTLGSPSYMPSESKHNTDELSQMVFFPSFQRATKTTITTTTNTQTPPPPPPSSLPSPPPPPTIISHHE